MEAKAFYSRNIWLTGFCVICLMFTTMMAFNHGLGGYYYNIALISVLLAFVMFFRLGCMKRHFFDIEDMFSCILHVLYGDLHYYLDANEFYVINEGRKTANFFYRLLLCVVFCGLAYIFLERFEGNSVNKFELHPFLAAAWAIISIVANITISAFIERRYRRFYEVEKPQYS